MSRGSAQDNAPFFFFHLPRTAGTTLNGILRDNFAPGEVLSIYTREDYERYREVDSDVLDGLRLIQGHIMPQSMEPPTLYNRRVRLFTFVREPVARLVSEYRFLRSWPQNHMFAYLNGNAVSFRRYLTGEEHQLRLRGRNFMTHSLAGRHCGISDADALELARRHLETSICFCGVQERFDESLLLLADVMGLQRCFYEPRNALRREAVLEISAEDRALAAELNRADAALHRYALALLERRIAAAGPAFAARLRKFRQLNAKYRKICELVDRKLQVEQKGPVIRPKL
ncbi:MAG: calcium-binding protein [Desulfovibrio desulfuricans]|nr:calcium-binding protein [Desulfovibrio desulfuricans]